MKNTASHITNLFRVNMPNEQSNREIKLAPSGYSWVLNRDESQNLIFFSLFIYIYKLSINVNQYPQNYSLFQVKYLSFQNYMELKHKISHVLPPSPKTFRGQPSFLEAGSEYLLYFNGSTVVLRPYDNSPTLFINHNCPVTAVKYSYGYKQIASLDQKGNLMIHIISNEGSDRILRLLFNYQGLYVGGRSIDWTSDNKRICIVGTGKNRFGRVIGVETGADLGEITGVSANLSTVSIRPEKPFKLATGGQQFTIKFFEGPPYKFNSSKISHKSYINQIKYSPDGKKFVSVGSDRKIALYDGTTSEILKQLEGGHASGIMGVTWIDNQTFVTGSSDKKLKKWDCNLQLIAQAESNENKQQLALIDSFVVAVSYNATKELLYYLLLSGQIKQIDKNLLKIGNSYEGYRGKIIKILTIPQQANSGLLLDDAGKLLKFTIQKQKFTYQRYFRHTLCYDKVFYDACISQTGIVYVLGGQSQLLTFNTKNNDNPKKQSVKLQEVRFINSIYSAHINAFIAYSNDYLRVYQEINGKYQKVGEHKLLYEPKFTKIDQNNTPQSSIILVGSEKGFVQIFSVETIEDNSIKVVKLLQCQTNKNKITFIQKHDDILFTGDSAGNIKVHRLIQESNKYQVMKVTDSMGGSHTTVINSILIVNANIYTLSLDNKISIWNLSDYSRFKTLLDVHRHGILCGEVVAANVCSSGGDLLIKIHQL